jgi:hypothetical protein
LFLVQSLLSSFLAAMRVPSGDIQIILVYQHCQHPFARLSFQPPMHGYVFEHLFVVSVIESKLVLFCEIVIKMRRIKSTMISMSNNINIHTIISPDVSTSKAK